jgi:predicted N-acetyltransferase YhbS/N-acetylglutamate synthase-like GNAT family acetyltransferase
MAADRPSWRGRPRYGRPDAETNDGGGSVNPPFDIGARVSLADGLLLRAATAEDVDAIVALAVEAFGASDEPGVRTYLSGPGSDIGSWTVVADGDRIVSTCGLLPLPFRLDGVRFAGGQIEYVVTDPAYQRRGLVRAQFDWHHAHAADLGHLALFIGGIPYLYRRFGYGYGVSYPDLFVFDRATLHPDPGVTLRGASTADIPALLALDATRPVEGLRVDREATHFAQWLEMAARGVVDGVHAGAERFHVAERGGEIVGWSALSELEHEKRLLLLPVVTRDAAVTDAIVAHGMDQAAQKEHVLIGHDTPGTAHGARVRAIGRPVPYGLGIYVRIPDPVAFLDALRPALSARLAASTHASAAGQVNISLYSTSVVLRYEAGVVTAVEPAPGVEDPFDDFACGVAPDWFPAFVLGRFGAAELERRVDDVTLGQHADLLEVLFPRRDADVVGDF